MHPAKRRRLDNAALTLNKPFRSPLPVEWNKEKPSSEKQDNQNSQASEQQTPPIQLSQIPQTSPDLPSSTSGPPLSLLPTPVGDISVGLSCSTRLPQTHKSARDQEYITLQKQHSALALKLKDVSSSLDTATQALKVTQSNTDDQLEHLVARWRVVSHNAAEQLFLIASDKIDRMGGVSVWREQCVKSRDHHPWSDKSKVEAAELTNEQQEQREMAREEAQQEAKKYGLHQEEADVTTEINNSFTMDMMLQQLNVDLKAIGYDVELQQWID